MKIYADFNGIFGDILCLSHSDIAKDHFGKTVQLQEGIKVTAFDSDADEHGNRDDLIAKGTVERSPDWLKWLKMVSAD